jgi:hypothetical protein
VTSRSPLSRWRRGAIRLAAAGVFAATSLVSWPSTGVAQSLAPTPPSGSRPPQQPGAPRVDVVLPMPAATRTEGPEVRPAQVLADRELRELVRNGFPARLHFRVELWSVGRWVDDQERKNEWDVYVRYDALNKTFRVLRVVGDRVQTVGQFADYDDAAAAVERPYRVPIAPSREGRKYYYNVTLDVEVLSVSDLDELEQWLRGELQPSLKGRKNPATALTRGARTLLVRLLGGEKRRYVQRSETFRAR